MNKKRHLPKYQKPQFKKKILKVQMMQPRSSFVSFVDSSLLAYKTSDRRGKSNIKYLNSGTLNIINKLKPATFDFKGGPKNLSGFIAQDVQNLLPDLVGRNSDGMLTINYNGFFPYLTSGIQEQQKLIKKLSEKIESLERELKFLKKKTV